MESTARVEPLDDHRKRPEKSDEPVLVTAIGISVVTSMPGDHGITLQCHMAHDMPIEEQHELVERLYAIADRQKARYELPELEEELHVHKKTLTRLEEDGKALERTYARAQAVRRAELKELERNLADEEKAADRAFKVELKALQEKVGKLEADRKAEFDAGYDEFAKSGRQGSYEPQGHRQINLNRMDQATEIEKKKLAEKLADRDRAIGVATAPAAKLITEKQEEIDKATSEHNQHVQQTDITKRRYRQEIDERELKIQKRLRILGRKSGEEEKGG